MNRTQARELISQLNAAYRAQFNTEAPRPNGNANRTDVLVDHAARLQRTITDAQEQREQERLIREEDERRNQAAARLREQAERDRARVQLPDFELINNEFGGALKDYRLNNENQGRPIFTGDLDRFLRWLSHLLTIL